jgi:Mrp family chromosome partitioning ATPase
MQVFMYEGVYTFISAVMMSCSRACVLNFRTEGVQGVKMIAFIAQKGGVGKTTLAVNLAVSASPKAALFDLYPQESAVIWADRRKDESPHVEFPVSCNNRHHSVVSV